jgi:hypothetical protein
MVLVRDVLSEWVVYRDMNLKGRIWGGSGNGNGKGPFGFHSEQLHAKQHQPRV